MIVLIISTIAFVMLLWLFYTRFFGAEYFPASRKVVKEMIKSANLTKKDAVYDLGCGDARILCAAAPKCRKAVGIEIDFLRFLVSKFNASYYGNAKVLRKNLLSQKLNDADVIFIFLRQDINDKLEKKCIKEMKKGSRIVSHYWKMKHLKPYKIDEKMRIYSYKI